jgi:two-component system response regulator NreC
MSIKVLIADDHQAMLSVMRQAISEESGITVVGQASTFDGTLQMIADLKPEVLLLDLHLPDQRDRTPEFIRSQLAAVPCTLAVSVDNSDEAKALAEGYGATALLDKMNLFAELIPAIVAHGAKWKEGTNLEG